MVTAYVCECLASIPQHSSAALSSCADATCERVSSLGLISNLIRVLVPPNAPSSPVMLLVSGGRLAAPELTDKRYIYVPALLFG